MNPAVWPWAGSAHSLGPHFTTSQERRLDEGLCWHSRSLSLCGLQFGQQGGRKASVCDWPDWGCILSASAAARSAESCEIAPEEDIDGQQEDGIDVADASPERLLLDAGQLLLSRGLLCWAQGLLWGPGEPAQPAPQQLSPGSSWGWE